MAPADDFVEDFVGADRALKRLALMRVRDIDLWQAPLAFVGQATGEVRAKLEGAEVRTPCSSTPSGARSGWLSESDLQADTVPATPDSGPEPILDLDDVMRDALADLLQTETQYAPVTDRYGPDRRRALRRDHLRVPRLARGEGRGARRGRAARRTPRGE